MTLPRIVILLVLIQSALVPMIYLAFLGSALSIQTHVEPAIVNGVLTVSAILLGFSKFTTTEKTTKIEHSILFTAMFGIQLTLFSLSGLFYFFDFLNHQAVTVLPLLLATLSLQFNSGWWFISTTLKKYWKEE